MCVYIYIYISERQENEGPKKPIHWIIIHHDKFSNSNIKGNAIASDRGQVGLAEKTELK